MSTTNLLSMLNNSGSGSVRGRSMAHRLGSSPSFSFMPRSVSSSLHKTSSTSNNNKESMVQIVKMNHMLKIKYKENIMFSFCKIEQYAKLVADKESKITDLPCEEGRTKVEVEKVDKMEKIRSGL